MGASSSSSPRTSPYRGRAGPGGDRAVVPPGPGPAVTGRYPGTSCRLPATTASQTATGASSSTSSTTPSRPRSRSRYSFVSPGPSTQGKNEAE